VEALGNCMAWPFFTEERPGCATPVQLLFPAGEKKTKRWNGQKSCTLEL